MSYIQCDLIEFLENSYFKDWVLTPTPESDTYWGNFIEENPEKLLVIHQASQILLQLSIDSEKRFPSEKKIAIMLQRIKLRSS